MTCLRKSPKTCDPPTERMWLYERVVSTTQPNRVLYVRQDGLEDAVARENRRDDLLEAALSLFVERGYEGTSVADLAQATDLSKAAFVYHFASKEELLFELSEPLLDELDEVVSRHEAEPSTDEPIRAAIDDYLAALCRHSRIAAWIDGDKSILNHGDLGARLTANNRRAHRLFCGPRPGKAARAQASAILGMLWRPIRNGYLGNDTRSQKAVAELAAHAAAAL